MVSFTTFHTCVYQRGKLASVEKDSESQTVTFCSYYPSQKPIYLQYSHIIYISFLVTPPNINLILEIATPKIFQNKAYFI